MKIPDNIHTLNCELCGGGHREEHIILCDRCDRGCHLFCLNPPLTGVPDGHWVRSGIYHAASKPLQNVHSGCHMG